METEDCPHCKGSGNEPYYNPRTKEIEYGENCLCQNCDVCLGYGRLPKDRMLLMKTQFFELLELLPVKVQNALLELAYERACHNYNSTLAVKYLESGHVVIETDKFDFTTMTNSRREVFSKLCSDSLSAWKEAWERLESNLTKLGSQHVDG